MATVQATNRTVTIEPRNKIADYEYGPTGAMAAGAVLITDEKMATVGAEVARVGYNWQCNLQLYDTIAGVSTGHDLDAYTTLTFSVWSHHARTAINTYFSFTKDGDQTTNPGLGIVEFVDTNDAIPGIYQFRLIGLNVSNAKEDLCSGWIVIKAQYQE